MKKFKLIKKYPYCKLNINDIIEFPKGCISIFEETKGGFILSELETYKEFWEEIIEKDYEILSIVSNSRNNIYSLDKKILNKQSEIDSWLKGYGKEYWDIHSIKKLSNDEIFTIDDKTNNGTISKFKIDSDEIRVFFEEKSKNYHVSLNSINHIKQPLFKTEDGVYIYEGDKYYYINQKSYNFTGLVEAFSISGPGPAVAREGNEDFDKKYEIKNFSTKEKAEEYLLMNKPCLSINDIFNIKNIIQIDSQGEIIIARPSTFKKLVKEKLKINK